MGAVDVGVRHDDDLLVAQIVVAVVRAHAAAERLDEVLQLLVLGQLVAARGGDVEDLAAQRQHRLAGPVARLLGRAAGRITLDDEQLGALRGIVRAVGELAGQAQLARRGLAGDVLLGAPAQALLGPLDDEVEQLDRLRRAVGEPMVERILDRLLDDAARLDGDELVLGLAGELRLADEHREHAGAAGHQIVGGDLRRALVADALGMLLQAAQQRDAQALLVGAAVLGRDGVAVGRDEALVLRQPGDRPFRGAMAAGPVGLAGEDLSVTSCRPSVAERR